VNVLLENRNRLIVTMKTSNSMIRSPGFLAGALLVLLCSGSARPQTAAKQSEKDASLPPLERVTRWVERFEAAEAGRQTGITPEETKKVLEQAATEMKTFLDAHHDDVDAIILSVRLARFQEAHRQVVVSGGGRHVSDKFEQKAKEARARGCPRRPPGPRPRAQA
jgi:hypothetical protein